MMTLRLEKPNPPRTEFYEADTIRVGRQDENGVISIATYSSGGMLEHFVGPLPGQAAEAYLMNATGKTVEVMRAS